MSDNIDKKLVTKINELFDNYEDDSAVEGWAKFQEKLPKENKKRGGFYWISSVAAVLLLLCGIWILIDTPNTDKQEIAKAEKTNAIEKTSPLANEKEDVVFPQEGTTKNEVSAVVASSKTIKNINKRSSTLASENNETQEVSAFNRIDAAESQNELTLLAILPKKRSLITDSAKADEAIMIARSAQTDNSQKIANDYDAMKTLPEPTNEPIQKKLAKEDKDIIFSIFGGSYMNYAKGSESSINTGLGFSSEFKISKKISISTGVSIGINSLEFNRAIPEQASLSFARANSTETMDMPAPQTPNIAVGSVIAPSYNIDTYNAKLTGFDIPVNLKYSVAGNRRSFYVLAGVSSNYFINESYTYDINYPMSYSNDSRSNTETSLSNSQTFNFAKMLNFSLGFDYPINKSIGLSVAPFVKVPIGGMGANDLRFGATGLNLNINLNRLK